jgi:DNA-binding IclR family transcriptional regulator
MPKHPPPVASKRRRRPKRLSSAAGQKQWGEQYHLKAIGRALDVIECFTDEYVTLNLKEIAALVKLPESSLFRILLTLESRGYLEQNADGAYHLPDRLIFGKLHERAARMRVMLHPYIEALARRFDETATIAYLFGNQARVIDTVETFQEVRLTNKVGRVLPPHCSSLGKAITAFQEPALIDEMIEVYGLMRRTANTIVERRSLLDEYARIRERGYSVDREEAVCGGICFGAPIHMPSGKVAAAISVSAPAVRMNPDREREIIQAVMATAQAADRELQRSAAK